MTCLSFTDKLEITHTNKSSKLRKSVFFHSGLVILLLLPLGLGIVADTYLKIIALSGLLYFFVRSIFDVRWSVTLYLLLFFLLPDTWAFDFGSFFPLITLRRMFFIIVVFSFILHHKKYKSKIQLAKPFQIALGFLVLSYTISTIFSVDFQISLFRLFHLVIELIFFMVIIFKVLHNKDLAKNGIIALCLSALILGIFANIEYITGVNHFTSVSLSDTSVRAIWSTYESLERMGILGRIHSLSTHPMAFGGFLAIIFPMAIAFVLMFKSIINKILFLTVALFCFEGVFLSIARSPLVALSVGCAIFLLFLFKKQKIKIVMFTIFTGIILLLFSVMFYKPTQTLLISSLKPWEQPKELKGSSLQMRLDQVKNTLAYSMNKPILGYGPGTGWTERIQVFNEDLVYGIENIWLLFLLEVGWVGVFCLFVFFFQAFILLMKYNSYSKGHKENMLAIGGISAFISFLIFSLSTGAMGTMILIFILIPLIHRSTIHNLVQDDNVTNTFVSEYK